MLRWILDIAYFQSSRSKAVRSGAGGNWTASPAPVTEAVTREATWRAMGESGSSPLASTSRTSPCSMTRADAKNLRLWSVTKGAQKYERRPKRGE